LKVDLAGQIVVLFKIPKAICPQYQNADWMFIDTTTAHGRHFMTCFSASGNADPCAFGLDLCTRIHCSGGGDHARVPAASIWRPEDPDLLVCAVVAPLHLYEDIG